MKNPLKSPLGMKPQGVGPKIFRPAVLCTLIGIIGSLFYPNITKYPFSEMKGTSIVGFVLLITGVLLYILTMVQFLKEFKKGKLITTGTYRLSRNPLYTSWILFILPGLSLHWNNWVILLASVIMCISFIRNIHVEEEQLQQAFGKEYEDYKQKVGRLFIFPKI
jgi:protein-S-isoprenylcysteine O-methyltransferase Ste14